MKRNKISNSSPSIVFPLLTLITIVVLFVSLTPKVSSKLFPFTSQHYLQTFTQSVESTNSIDPQLYWQFREFYSPGYFSFNKNGVESNIIEQAAKKMNISLNTQSVTPFLVFHSKNTTSIDALTESDSLENILVGNINGTHILNQPNEKIIQDGEFLYIIFLKNQDEMRTANGFYDYQELDTELVRDKKWFNITKVRTDY